MANPKPNPKPAFQPEKQTRYVVFTVPSCRACFHLVYLVDGSYCTHKEDDLKRIEDEDEIPGYCKLPKSLKEAEATL